MTVPLLSTSDPACARRLEQLFSRAEQAGERIEATVRAIVRDVKRRGDRALLAATKKFDRVRLSLDTLRVTDQELDAALAGLPKAERTALQTAAKRISAFHRKQRQSSWRYTDRLGVSLGQQITPLERVGVYVPGGKAAYPSSVLMNVIPAKVAGVEDIVVVSPPSADGEQAGSPVLAAARLAGADTVFRLGGAQAIAALAYGTQTVPRVDKIVGPGNIFVATAKRLVYGQVDIDSVAGPSEILVIADSTAPASYVAADMLSQAEHDEMAAPVCLTTSKRLATAVVEALKGQLATLSRRTIAAASLNRYGAVIVARDRAEVVRLANALAPEHLELLVKNPRSWLSDIRHAGAIFVGALSTEPFGDYMAGPNHILPTGGTARFSSPLGVYDFLKRTSIIEASAPALRALGPHIMRLAAMEGLEAHGRAVAQRLKGGQHDSPAQRKPAPQNTRNRHSAQS